MSVAHPLSLHSGKDTLYTFVRSCLLLLFILLIVAVPAADAGQVTVAWDQNPETDVTGYKIYYGTSSGSYSASVDVAGRTTTSVVISGLQDGVTYFFAAVAHDGTETESGFSNEISYAVPAAATTASSSGGGGGCFIATAAFGNYDAPEVILLRKFRDSILLTNAPGRLFVDFYYRVSPSLAEYIGRHDALKGAARVALQPVVFSIQHSAGLYASVLVLLLGTMTVVLFEQRRIRRELEKG